MVTSSSLTLRWRSDALTLHIWMLAQTRCQIYKGRTLSVWELGVLVCLHQISQLSLHLGKNILSVHASLESCSIKKCDMNSQALKVNCFQHRIVTSNNNNKEINITMRLNPGKGTSSFDLSDFHGPKFFNSLNIEIQNIGFLFLLSQQMLQTYS